MELDRIARVSLDAFKGITASFDIHPLTLVVGDNWSGKSAILEGIQFACQGAVSFGKQERLVAMVAGPRGCSSCVELSDGFKWSRSLLCDGPTNSTAISITGEEPMGINKANGIVKARIGDFAPMWAPRGFEVLGPEKQRDLIVSLCGRLLEGEGVSDLARAVLGAYCSSHEKIGAGVILERFRDRPYTVSDLVHLATDKLDPEENIVLAVLWGNVANEIRGEMSDAISAGLQKAEDAERLARAEEDQGNKAAREIAARQKEIPFTAGNLNEMKEELERFQEDEKALLVKGAEAKERAEHRANMLIEKNRAEDDRKALVAEIAELGKGDAERSLQAKVDAIGERLAALNDQTLQPLKTELLGHTDAQEAEEKVYEGHSRALNEATKTAPEIARLTELVRSCKEKVGEVDALILEKYTEQARNRGHRSGPGGMRKIADLMEEELKTLPAEPDRTALSEAGDDEVTVRHNIGIEEETLAKSNAELEAAVKEETNPWVAMLDMFAEFCAHLGPGTYEVAKRDAIAAYIGEQVGEKLVRAKRLIKDAEGVLHDLRNKLQVAQMKREDLATTYKTALEMHEGAKAKIEERGKEVIELRSQAEYRDVLAREKAKLWEAEEGLATLQEATGKVDLDVIRAAHEASHKKLEDLTNTIAPIKKKADEAESDWQEIHDAHESAVADVRNTKVQIFTRTEKCTKLESEKVGLIVELEAKLKAIAPVEGEDDIGAAIIEVRGNIFVSKDAIECREGAEACEKQLALCRKSALARGLEHTVAKSLVAAIRSVRESFMRRLAKPVLDQMAEILAHMSGDICSATNPCGGPYLLEPTLKLQVDGRKRVIFEYGWNKDGEYRTLQALCGGEKAIYISALGAAIANIADVRLKLLMLDVESLSPRNLLTLMKGLSFVKDRIGNVILATHLRPPEVPHGWHVIDQDVAPVPVEA